MAKMRYSLFCKLSVIGLLCAAAFAETLTITGTTDIKDAKIVGSTTGDDLNHGGDDQLWVGRNVTFNEHALLRADYLAIPAGSTINSAVCSLYCDQVGATDDTIVVFQVLRDWREGTGDFSRQDSFVTFKCRGWGLGEDNTTIDIADSAWYAAGLNATAAPPRDADFPTDTVVVPGSTGAGSWYVWDITSMVEDQAFGQDNFGMYFREKDLAQAGRAFFASSEAASNGPRVFVDYTPPAAINSELIIVHDE